MRTIICPQFRQDTLDSAFDRFFADRKPGCDFLICMPVCQKLQDFHFPIGQRLIEGVICQFRRNVGRNGLTPRVDASNCIEKVLVEEILEQLGLCTGL